MAVGDAHAFSGFLTPLQTQLFFPKPPTIFLTCFCRGERRKYVGKKSRLNRGSNSLPPGHESDTLTTEPPGRGFNHYVQLAYGVCFEIYCISSGIFYMVKCFKKKVTCRMTWLFIYRLQVSKFKC